MGFTAFYPSCVASDELRYITQFQGYISLCRYSILESIFGLQSQPVDYRREIGILCYPAPVDIRTQVIY